MFVEELPIFFPFWTLLEPFLALSGGLPETAWGRLGGGSVPFSVRFGSKTDPKNGLRTSWGRLGGVLGRLGASGERLEGVLGCLGSVLAASWGRLGASWESLGDVLGRLGGVLGHLVLDFRPNRLLNSGLPS